MSLDFFRIHKGLNLTPQSSAPSSPAEGDLYFDSTLVKLRVYENGAWVNVTAGNVVGPASSTDEAIARFDGTTGKLVQNSVVTITDAGAATGFTTIVATSSITGASLIPSSSTIPTNGVYLPAANTVGIAANSLAHTQFSNSSGSLVVQFNTTSTNGTFLRNAVADGLMSISSDTASSAGSNIRMFGSTHATQAFDFELRQGSTNVYQYDHSAVSHLFAGDTIDLNTSTSASIQLQRSGTNVLAVLNNGTETGSAALIMAVDGATATDPYIRFTLTGVDSWSLGIDNSDSDAFVFSNSSTLGTTNRFRVAGNSFQVNVGSGASPSYSFIGDSGTGIFRGAASVISFAGGGVQIGQIAPSGNNVNFQLNNISNGIAGAFAGVSTGLFILGGDTGTNSGSTISLYGASHASQASDFELKAGATVVYQYDHSALTQNLNTLTVIGVSTDYNARGQTFNGRGVRYQAASSSSTNKNLVQTMISRSTSGAGETVTLLTATPTSTSDAILIEIIVTVGQNDGDGEVFRILASSYFSGTAQYVTPVVTSLSTIGAGVTDVTCVWDAGDLELTNSNTNTTWSIDLKVTTRVSGAVTSTFF